MGRPADWSPLAGSDPVPGDPAGINAAAAHLSSVADQIAGQVAVLRKIAASHSEEKGEHAGKLQSAAADTAGKLDKVTGRYKQSAAALSAWVPELEHAQAQSLKALTAAQDAHARQQAHQPVQRPPHAHVTAEQQQQDHARGRALNQANADLAAAQSMLDDAVAHRDAKASEAAAKIDGAVSMDADSFWASMWADLKSFVDRYAWLIKDICTVLEVIATILAVVALFIPGLDILVAIGIGLTALALVGRAMLAATGNGSWLDVGMDALALVSFGATRIIGTALTKGTAVARTAAQTVSRARLLDEAEPALNAFRSLITHEGPEEINALSRQGVKLIYQSVAADSKLPEFAKLGEGGIKAALRPQNIADGLKTVLPRIASGGDEAGRTSAQALGHLSEHFPEIDASNVHSLLNAYRANFAVGTGLPMAHLAGTGVEIDGPNGPTAINGHIPGTDPYVHYVDGKWTTTSGGLPIFQ